VILTITSTHTLPSCVDTVWLFNAIDDDGAGYVVGVDHRPATILSELLNVEGPVKANVDEWQILQKRSGV